MNAMQRLIDFGSNSKKNLKMAKKIKDSNLDEECTFKPKFYTNPKSRLMAKAKRKSQASLLLELE